MGKDMMDWMPRLLLSPRSLDVVLALASKGCQSIRARCYYQQQSLEATQLTVVANVRR